MMHLLLAIHIGSGATALVASMVAIISAKGKKQHVRAGRVYFLGMLGIFITAIPMALVSGNQFLFITAIFSFYLAFAGLRFARNRTGVAATVDWIAVLLMLLSGVGLWLLAAVYFIGGNADFVIPVVFGTVALALGFETTARLKIRRLRGRNGLLATSAICWGELLRLSLLY